MRRTVTEPCTSVKEIGTLTVSCAARTASTTSGSPAQNTSRSTSTLASSPVSCTLTPSMRAGTFPNEKRSNRSVVKKDGRVACKIGSSAATMTPDVARSRYGHALSTIRFNHAALSTSRNASHDGKSDDAINSFKASGSTSLRRYRCRPAAVRSRRSSSPRCVKSVPVMKPPAASNVASAASPRGVYAAEDIELASSRIAYARSSAAVGSIVGTPSVRP
mmetsp:Transcript_31485/g.102577  ORF Transcript_31485/g.102577 Transcript_31485/m.102577 type:complete len:219 (+) Transcript_31485:1641-2297(+)